MGIGSISVCLIVASCLFLIIKHQLRKKKVSNIKYEALKHLTGTYLEYESSLVILQKCLSLTSKESEDFKDQMRFFFNRIFNTRPVEEIKSLIDLCINSKHYFNEELGKSFSALSIDRLGDIFIEVALDAPSTFQGIVDAKKTLLLYWYLHRNIQEYYFSKGIIKELEDYIASAKSKDCNKIILRAEIAKIQLIAK